jgi:hypothetical protein
VAKRDYALMLLMAWTALRSIEVHRLHGATSTSTEATW